MSYAIIYEYDADGEAIIHAITNANSIINEARYAYPNSYVILYEWSKISLNTDNSYLISEMPEDYFPIDEPDDFSDYVVFFYYDRWGRAVITNMGAYNNDMQRYIVNYPGMNSRAC